ncbi:tripeptidyl-peptidase 2-like [Quercus suber]|uniref:tripeptidyl-peptidase 2-like n=1 Tax=Quercus suber TaxID=58331 RepID=UPI0032DE6AA2
MSHLMYILPNSCPLSFSNTLTADEDKGKGSSSTGIKTVSERLEEESEYLKYTPLLAKILEGLLSQSNIEDKIHHDEESEYLKYTLLLAKILEGLLSQSNIEDKIHHDEEVIDSANEVVDSIDREELAKFLSLKSDPEDEEAEKNKKKMEITRDQLAEALYQKGLALADIESLKSKEASSLASSKDLEITRDQSQPEAGVQPDLFEENFKELKKWVDLKSSKYGTLLVLRERRSGRLGTALKALNDIIQDDGEPPKKKLYELKLSLLDEIGWSHLATYERQWMHVRFPASLPLF